MGGFLLDRTSIDFNRVERPATVRGNRRSQGGPGGLLAIGANTKYFALGIEANDVHVPVLRDISTAKLTDCPCRIAGSRIEVAASGHVLLQEF